MKIPFIFLAMFCCLPVVMWGQDEDLPPREDEGVVGILNGDVTLAARPPVELEHWISLGHLSVSEYMQELWNLLEASGQREDIQPYILAECLWFNLFVEPAFTSSEGMSGPKEKDGSVDGNLVSLSDMVGQFLKGLGDGSIPAHEWSNTVYSFFRHLALLQPIPRPTGTLPDLPALTVSQSYLPPDELHRVSASYRGLMDFERLLRQYAAAEVSAEEESVGDQTSEGGDLPPAMGGINWMEVVSNQPLMYIVRNSQRGGSIYMLLEEYSAHETAAFYCEDRLARCLRLGREWGFPLEQVLPDFSRSVLSSVKEDVFLLSCMTERDLVQFDIDLDCIVHLAPVYFSRLVSYLRVDSQIRKDGGL